MHEISRGSLLSLTLLEHRVAGGPDGVNTGSNILPATAVLTSTAKHRRGQRAGGYAVAASGGGMGESTLYFGLLPR